MVEHVMKQGIKKQETVRDGKVLVISNSAAKLFSKKGYVETSMDDISGAVKLSKGGMYHYFRGKDEILEFILSTFLDTVLQNAEHDIGSSSEPVAKIRAVIDRHVKTYAENMYAAKVLLHEAHNLPASKYKKIKNKERRYFAMISGILADYLGGGTDKTKLTVLTFNLLGMCNWIYSWYDPKGPMPSERLGEMIFETVIKGLSGVGDGAV
jgi:AcrR family transcriptional regulator